MKFWEALKEMEAGAECQAMIGNDIPGLRHRWLWGKLEVWDEGRKQWITSPATVNGSNCTWRIVKPAPSDAKPEPHADDWGSRMNQITAKNLSAKPNPHEDVSLRMRTAKLENDVCELSANRDALSKRVEALEENAKSKDETSADLHGYTNRRIYAIESKLAALEASKPNPPAIPDSSPVAWPKGSLQWAEVEAKRRGMPRIRRLSCPGSLLLSEPRWSLSSETWSALDWEPCE